MSAEERVLIVDKDNNVITEKNRNDLVNDDCWRIVSVWVQNPEGKVLLQQRSLDKKVAPGCWTAAAEGTVDYKDSYEETAIREVTEELGLNGLTLLPAGKYYGPWAGFGKRQCQGYKAVYDGPIENITIQTSELHQVAWMTLEEIEQLHLENPELFPLYNIYRELGFIPKEGTDKE